MIARHRYRQQGPKPGFEGEFAEGMIVRCCHVGNLDRLAAFGGLADRRFAQINRRLWIAPRNSLLRLWLATTSKALTGCVEFKDSTAIRFREIHCIASDRVKYLPQIQRRANRAAYLAKGAHLFKRKLKLACPLLDFLKQADVLDGDHRLVGESFDQRHLFIAKRPHFPPPSRNNSDEFILPKHRNGQNRAYVLFFVKFTRLGRKGWIG